ncbi:MAG: amidohydrolase [Candidatus Delongbacteria bacterium]|nr:amidohydrolase [Candidatus Delongbacteria bacterium]
MEVDTLIKNALILTMNKNNDDILNGFIGIKGDSIVYAGQIDPKVKYKTSINARGNIVMPGLINAHTHSPMSIYRGLADDIALFDWLNNHIWPVEKKFVTEENIGLASELSIAEMIKSGTTTFNDMYFYSNITGKKAKEIGMRAVLGEAIIDIPKSVYKISEHYWINTAEKADNNGLIRTSIVPHSPYSCSEEILKNIKAVSKKHKVLIHTHISETKNEVEQIKNKFGMTPVEYLDSLNFLDKNTIAVHCVVLSDKDIEILSKRNVKIVHCPQSNLKLASGIARIKDMKKAGLTIALGTDGPASNNSLDMFAEMKIAAILHKGINNDPTAMSAKEVVKMATVNGAVSLGLENITGSIEVGKKADLIIVDTNSLHLTPMYDPYSHLVYSAIGSDVDTVIINGKILLRNKKLLSINEEELKRKVNLLSKDINKFKISMEAQK